MGAHEKDSWVRFDMGDAICGEADGVIWDGD